MISESDAAIVDIIKGSLLNKEKRIVFFIGAGISHSSGIPLGEGLKKKILKNRLIQSEDSHIGREQKFRSIFKQYEKRDYISLEMVLQAIYEKLGFGGLRDSIESELNGSKEPNIAHITIAKLANENLIEAVITTNLDQLIEQALTKEDVDFESIFSDNKFSNNKIESLNKFIVYKVHGDWKDLRSLTITKDQVQRFTEPKKNILKYYLENYIIVFVGYSMRDLDVLEVIRETQKKDMKYRIYVVDPNPITDDVDKILENFESQENYIQATSDEFFAQLIPTPHSQPLIWKASEANLIDGQLRDENDEWNDECPPWVRVFGSARGQNNYKDWEGAKIQLKAKIPQLPGPVVRAELIMD